MDPGTECIDLSWRTLPTPGDIQSKIHSFLLNFDANGCEWIEVAASTGKLAVRLEKVQWDEDTADVLVRYNQPIKKQLPSDKVCRRQNFGLTILMFQQAYIAKIVVLLQYLVKVVSAQQMIKSRQVFYAAIPGINSSTLKSLLDNMALTLRLHPWSLLIEAEETGKVSLGTGIRLTLDLITNLAQAAILAKEKGIEAVYANNECHERITLNRDRVYQIPLRIMRIRNPNETGIRAVIVVEHRNIGAQMAWLKDNTSNVVIVMVSSHPT